MRELLIEKYEKPDSVNRMGDVFWFNWNGLLHRDNDKPAVILRNGSKIWYKNGHVQFLT